MSVGMWIGTAIMKASMEVLKNTVTTIKSNPPPTGCITKEKKSLCQISVISFIISLFTMVKIRTSPRCPLAGEWVKRMLYMSGCWAYHLRWSLWHPQPSWRAWESNSSSAPNASFLLMCILEAIGRVVKTLLPRLSSWLNPSAWPILDCCSYLGSRTANEINL